MHQAVAPALGQVDVGDGAVQPVRRVNGEVCGAVELLVGPDIAEFPTVGERLAGLDLEPDNSHGAPPHSCTGHLYHQFAAPARRSAKTERPVSVQAADLRRGALD
jgi:hypothetical protein